VAKRKRLKITYAHLFATHELKMPQLRKHQAVCTVSAMSIKATIAVHLNARVIINKQQFAKIAKGVKSFHPRDLAVENVDFELQSLKKKAMGQEVIPEFTLKPPIYPSIPRDIGERKRFEVPKDALYLIGPLAGDEAHRMPCVNS
jgi:hypothetical protein